MRTVRMNKAELSAIVKANRNNHRAVFERALQGFHVRVIEELENRLHDARKGRHIDIAVSLPLPEDHTADYDRVLKMLKYEVDEIVELDQHEFEQYVQDDWGWKGRFFATTAMYDR